MEDFNNINNSSFLFRPFLEHRGEIDFYNSKMDKLKIVLIFGFIVQIFLSFYFFLNGIIISGISLFVCSIIGIFGFIKLQTKLLFFNMLFLCFFDLRMGIS